MMKRILSAVLLTALLIGLFSAITIPASAATSGITGDCTWTLNGTELTISGNGAMEDYDYYYRSPWGTDVTKVTICDGVTTIGVYAFYGCAGLISVTIGDSVTSIGSSAFSNCTGMTSVTIGDGVTTIGENAFCDCTKLTSITIGNGVSSIGDYAFYGTKYYKDVQNWDEDVLYIGNYLIEVKKTISGDYSIKEGTRFIGEDAFANCTGLTSIAIPNSVIYIGPGAFFGCVNLASISIPDSVRNLGYGSFDVTAYSNDESNWEDDVLYIGNHLYWAKGSVSGKYEIKPGTKTIGYQAFCGCDRLKSVVIPSSVVGIGGFAFSSCENLEKVYIDDLRAWCEIELGAYDVGGYYASPLREAEYLYLNGTLLKDVVIPEGIQTINPFAFSSKGIATISIPDSVKEIGYRAFFGCVELSSISIPEGVTTIDSNAFSGCVGLTSISIPSTITEIWEDAFSGCDNLEKCYIKDLTAWCNIRFYGQYDWEPAIHADELYIDGNLTQNLVLPDGIKEISNFSFESIQSVTVPNSVITIRSSSFNGCSNLLQVYLPKNLEVIEKGAFNGCRSFKYVFYGGNEEELDNLVIESSNDALRNAKWHYNSADHKYGEYIYNNNATALMDGTKTRTCGVCGETETVTAEGTRLEPELIDSSKKFTDVPKNQWYKQYVDYAVTYGIFNGTSAKNFSPNLDMTRAQVVMVFANISGIDVSNNNISSGFTDVKKGEWYTAAVAWAARNGIVNGVGNGRFDPNAKVTREQMCVMIVNYIENYRGETLNQQLSSFKFADDSKISSWAKAAVYKCARAKLVNGVGNNKFDPKATATRAQGATLFSTLHKEYIK